MKNSLIVVCFLATSVILSTCSKDNEQGNNSPDPIKIDLSATELKMANENQGFAFNLFSVVHELQADDENIVLSPLSLNMALAMVWNGAKGETKQAIQEAMGMGNYPQSEVNGYFKKLREAFIKTDPTVKLAIANSIWSLLGFPVKNGFYDINRKYYDAEVKEVDFASSNTPKLINQWCSDNTNGLIKEIIKEIPGDAMMYLLNALYFKGEWSDKFGFDTSGTRDTDFKKENGSSTRVKMMSQNNTLPYYQDEYLSTTALPFGNNAFSMVFILPNETVSFIGMLNQLKLPGYFEKCMQSESKAEVDLYLPKFKIENEVKLVETLKQLGMGIAFSPEFADFSDISDACLYISDVRQKTSVSIDEKGGEAAAVTIVEVKYTSVGPPSLQKVVFRADRPFMFAIRENSTGVILFMGKIGGPNPI